MDFTTIIGFVMGLFLMVLGIGFGSIGNFYDLSSIYITVGGTIAALVLSSPKRLLLSVPSHLKIAFTKQKYDVMKTIDTLVEFAQVARRNGLLALEQAVAEEPEPFLKDSILLLVDGVGSDKVREMLTNNIDNAATRHEEAVSLYEKGAAFGPAFGMLGTLIGLINMLLALDISAEGAAETLGQGMSVALITTFYGSVLANLLFQPLANKLASKSDEELLYKSIIMEGVLSIQAGGNPQFIKDSLMSLLPKKTKAIREKRTSSKEAA